ncbi:MAG TPA: VTT domain-containing protein [Bryobacteraceae bacterium]|jgi:membrane-associated protein
MAGFLLDIWKSLTDPDRLIHLLTQVVTGWLGYALLAGVVFAESGLLIGLFLPGDSLLFTVGVVAGAGDLNIVQICVVLCLASILGDQCGYFLGYRTGPAIFSRPDSRWFKQEYVARTQHFYEKHGGKTLIYAKFVPIVRAFAPYMAGVGRMKYIRFLSFNIWGGLGWVLSMTLGGYALGNYPFVRKNFEKVVLGIVFVSVAPLVWHYLQSRRTREIEVVAPEPVPEIPE